VAKLYLKFDEAVLKEFPLSEGVTTVGRLPDNTLQIDNLAVSGHHCRIYTEGDQFFVEDSNSLNGTYVNRERVNKSPLRDGDVVLVGRHTLEFKAEASKFAGGNASRPAPPVMNSPSVRATNNASDPSPTIQVAAPRPKQVGVLTVLEGKADEPQYVLTGSLTVIGKSEMASIRLKGWFAPRVAANLMKRDGKYVISAGDKDVKISINGAPLAGQRELAENDTVEVAGLKLQFSYQQ
jgi:predicted component of type VI protein secretion system